RHLAQLVGLEHGLRPSVRFPRDLRLALLEAGQYPLDAELEFVQSVCGGDLLGSPHRSLGAPEAAEARLTDPLLQVEVRADVRWHVVHARFALLPPAANLTRSRRYEAQCISSTMAFVRWSAPR